MSGFRQAASPRFSWPLQLAGDFLVKMMHRIVRVTTIVQRYNFNAFVRHSSFICENSQTTYRHIQNSQYHRVCPPLHNDNTRFYRKDQRRTLIQETLQQFVKMKRLTGSDSGIIEVILDRPGAKNAIGNEMLRDFQHTLEGLNVDSAARVILLCSSLPRIFCAGADLKERRSMSASEVKTFVNTLRSTFSLLEAISVPTIAVIEGAALGGGLELALSCDLRICGDVATFGLPETGLAIIPGAGGTQRLPRLIGRSQAKELIFTGRKLDGKEAMTLGLVDHCVSAGEAYSKALEIAREINTKGPLAIKLAKVAINHGCEVDTCSGMFIEESCYMELLNSNDRLEGLAAFAEKRKPRYTGD